MQPCNSPCRVRGDKGGAWLRKIAAIRPLQKRAGPGRLRWLPWPEPGGRSPGSVIAWIPRLVKGEGRVADHPAAITGGIAGIAAVHEAGPQAGSAWRRSAIR